VRHLTAAQLDFLLNDRDGNGVHDFWRGDIAGLYGLVPPGQTDPMALIETGVAEADVRPGAGHSFGARPPVPYWGHWFKALRHAGETDLSPNRFAACAYPVRYQYRRRWTYIVSEENVVYRKKLREPWRLEIYPADPIVEGWKKPD